MTPNTSLDFDALTIDGVVKYWASRTPDAIALQFERGSTAGVRLSWRELELRVEQRARKLREAGVRKLDNVALALEDDPDCHVCVYAIMRIGAVMVPIDPTWGVDVVNAIKAKTSFGLLLCVTREMAQNFDYVAEAVCIEDIRTVDRNHTSFEESNINDLALIAFTSGTTSAPKGVALTHRNLRTAYRSGVDCLGLTDRTRNFVCVFRLSGLGVLGVHYFLANEVGANTIVLPMLTASNCRDFWQRTRPFDPGFLYLVPTLVKLLNHYSIPLQDPVSDLVCVTSAAPIPQDTFDYFQTRFGVPLRNIYGLTELSFAVFFGATNEQGFGLHTIGPAIGVEAKLIDSNGGVIPDGEGEGELYLRGPMLADGYYKNPEATADVFIDGWLKTGDLAIRDSQGRYTIVGRAKDVVIRGGFNISLAEIDEILAKHPHVVDSCSFGVPDAIAGEELMCLVYVRSEVSVSEAELKEWVSHRAGSYKTPRRILFSTAELPRNGAGKLLRKEAKSRAAEILALTHA